jgi:hypothetical protein
MALPKMRFLKKIEKFHYGHFLPILATFYKLKITLWKKLVQRELPYPKSITGFSATTFGSTSPSAWCVYVRFAINCAINSTVKSEKFHLFIFRITSNFEKSLKDPQNFHGPNYRGTLRNSHNFRVVPNSCQLIGKKVCFTLQNSWNHKEVPHEVNFLPTF